MLKIEIPASDRRLLQVARYSHPHPRVMLKMDALHLKSFGLKDSLICEILDICDNTLRSYYKQYLAGGIEGLKEINFYQPCSDLNEFSGTIEDYFKAHPPSSIAQASAIIEKLTGIKRGETQTRKFLKTLKFRYIKTCSVPAKSLTEEKKTNRGNFWKKTSNLD